MSKSFLAFAFLAFVAFALSSTHVRSEDRDPAAIFDELFASKIKAARNTRSFDDDVVVAMELVSSAELLRKYPDVLKRVLIAAVDLSSKKTDGYGIAIDATIAWEKQLPAQRIEAIERRVQIRQKIYRTAKAAERPAAAEALLNDQMALARSYFGALDLAQASRHARAALIVAKQIRSDQQEAITAFIAAIPARAKAVAKINRLKKQFKDNPQDESAARGIVLMYLFDFKNPSEAGNYVAQLKNENLKTFVRTSSTPASELSAEDALASAEIYFQLTKEPARAKQVEFYEQALARFKQYRSLKPEDKTLNSAKATARIFSLGKWLEAHYSKLRVTAEYMDRITAHLLMDQFENDQGREGLNGWRKNANGDAGLPVVMVNASNKDLTIPQTALAGSVMTHPPSAGGAGIAWKCPSAGTYRITGSVADAHACGNSVSWKLQALHAKGHKTLASGSVEPQGISQFISESSTKALAKVQLKAGEMIQLVVLPKGDYSCDLSRVVWSITEVGSRRRVWNLAKDIVPDLLEKGKGNPHSDSHGNKDVWYFYEVPPDKVLD